MQMFSCTLSLVPWYIRYAGCTRLWNAVTPNIIRNENTCRVDSQGMGSTGMEFSMMEFSKLESSGMEHPEWSTTTNPTSPAPRHRIVVWAIGIPHTSSCESKSNPTPPTAPRVACAKETIAASKNSRRTLPGCFNLCVFPNWVLGQCGKIIG